MGTPIVFLRAVLCSLNRLTKNLPKLNIGPPHRGPLCVFLAFFAGVKFGLPPKKKILNYQNKPMFVLIRK